MTSLVVQYTSMEMRNGSQNSREKSQSRFIGIRCRLTSRQSMQQFIEASTRSWKGLSEVLGLIDERVPSTPGM